MNPLHVRIAHYWLAFLTLPGLLRDRRQRALLAEIRQFIAALPARLAEPLPTALATLDPTGLAPPPITAEAQLRRLVDLAALLDRRSGLGLCLRRSLARYHYLGRAGILLEVQFGAQLLGPPGDRDLTGHAWLTRNGRPYHEAAANYKDFTVVFAWPPSPSPTP